MNVCSGCGLSHCDGRCFSECEADYPDTCRICSTTLDDGLCSRCDAHLTECEPDPLRHVEPKRRAA
jgi:hypothetical protein